MTAFTDDENDGIEELAGRLRVIQAESGAVAPELRREFLSEEIARKLKDVPAGNRKRYLSQLLTRFPVRGELAKPGVPGPGSVSAPTVKPVERTPEEMLGEFLGATTGLPEERLARLGERLAEAGFLWTDRAAVVLEASQELRQMLGLEAQQQVSLKRLMDLTVLLVDAFQRLDERAIATFREFNSKSQHGKRSQAFKSVVAQFLLADDKPIEPQLRAISSLLGALLAALQGGGREFGRYYVDTYLPEKIEEMVTAQGGGGILFGPTKKERCWDHYNTLAKDLATAELVDRKIKDLTARFLESKVLGGR